MHTSYLNIASWQAPRKKRATLREFAASLSEALQSAGRRVSYQSVKNWGDRRYLPDAFSMLRLSQAARFDWRGDFAGDILAALHPETYQPATEIGRRALKAGQELVVKIGGNSNGNGHKS